MTAILIMHDCLSSTTPAIQALEVMLGLKVAGAGADGSGFDGIFGGDDAGGDDAHAANGHSDGGAAAQAAPQSQHQQPPQQQQEQQRPQSSQTAPAKVCLKSHTRPLWAVGGDSTQEMPCIAAAHPVPLSLLYMSNDACCVLCNAICLAGRGLC
jgi:hypothetical protein